MRELYLQNANHPIGALVDEYCNLNSLGLGIVDEMLLNQLLGKHKHLRRLEIKVREELRGGELIANYTIKRLSVHSLGVRADVCAIVRACPAVEVLGLLNCLLTEPMTDILIENDRLRTLDIQNDYSDADIGSGRRIARCFERCSHLTTGLFKNVNLKAFYTPMCSLAERNRQTLYRLHLDGPESEAFGGTENRLPANLMIFELRKDYSY